MPYDGAGAPALKTFSPDQQRVALLLAAVAAVLFVVRYCFLP